ncbi:MAG: septation protein IspZ [Gammaproteobacteria bacterium]|nr:septation protein IspZ [Pseudomonadota bacterium]MCH9663389.1 septation protein IspZ [Gammaproteobacteria bacterium]
MHKFSLEWLPIIAFVAVYYVSDIYTATIAIVAVSAASWLWCKLSRFPMTRVQEYTVWALWVFGGLTIALRDPLFIMWKPTVVYVCLALVMAVNARMSDHPLMRRALERFYRLSTAGWARLQFTWAGLFVLLGAANLLVAYNFSEAIWVQYKLFGTLVLTVILFLGQMWVLRHYLISEAISGGGRGGH